MTIDSWRLNSSLMNSQRYSYSSSSTLELITEYTHDTAIRIYIERYYIDSLCSKSTIIVGMSSTWNGKWMTWLRTTNPTDWVTKWLNDWLTDWATNQTGEWAIGATARRVKINQRPLVVYLIPYSRKQKHKAEKYILKRQKEVKMAKLLYPFMLILPWVTNFIFMKRSFCYSNGLNAISATAKRVKCWIQITTTPTPIPIYTIYYIRWR